MSQFKCLVFTFLIIPALVVGCGKSNDEPVNKDGDFFGDDFVPNTSITIYDLVNTDQRFDTFTEALQDTNLDRTLDQQGQFTVFAPSDAAFERLPSRARRVLRTNPSILRQVLLHHIVRNEMSVADIAEEIRLGTLGNTVIRVRQINGSTFLGQARLVQGDGFVANGVVHVVDEVLIPRRLRPRLGL